MNGYRTEMILASALFILIVAFVLLMQRTPAEEEEFIAISTQAETEAEPSTEAETEIIIAHQPEYISGMPCDLFSDDFIKETETTAENTEIQCEKGEEQDELQTVTAQVYTERGTSLEGRGTEVPVTEPESTEAETAVETVQEHTQNQADSEVDIYEYLRIQLEEKGVGYFYEYALCQLLQESGGNVNAVSPDGKDKGLFQYREQYWTQPESIFDPYAQIRLYTTQVANRLNSGLSIEETISRHYTSDYVQEVNWEYVNAVLNRMH